MFDFGKFASAFGNQVKAVITGMVVGIFLLPIGVVMQKCAVDQMQYHKIYDKAVTVNSPSDAKIQSSTIIKTEGDFLLSDASPYEVKNSEGDVYPNRYITYSEVKKIPVRKERKVKDSDGNEKIEITYEWEDAGKLSSSPDNVSITVNGFNSKFSNFSQKYIESKTTYFKYKKGFSYGDNSSTVITSDGSYVTKIGSGSGFLDKPSQSDINEGVYVKELTGYVYDEADKTMTLSGIASNSSGELNPVKGKWGQTMLVASYANLSGTFDKLKSSAEGERLMKFIIGTLCFMFGFSGIFGPVIKVLDIIPFIGKLANGILYFLFAIISLVLSVLFYVFFQFYWLILAAAILIPLIMYFLKKKKTA